MKKWDLNFLACPECKGRLEYLVDDKSLKCMECGKRYPVIEEIPILLPEKEAKNVLRNTADCHNHQ